MESTASGSNSCNSLGDYEVVSPIGRGASSFVYKVRHRKDNSFLALKTIDRQKLRAKASSRLKQEVMLHMKLEHENIVKFHKCFQDKSNIYLLIEYCEVGELYKLIASGDLNCDKIKKYGKDLAMGIKYIHSQGVVHRDLKPGNLFIDANDSLKIGDFGLSYIAKETPSKDERFCGTPNYMAPEMILCQEYGQPIDVWAFGCIMYYMQKKCSPFEFQGGDFEKRYKKIKEFKVDFLGLDDSLSDLIKRCLETNPKDRITINDVLNHRYFGAEKKHLPSAFIHKVKNSSGIQKISYKEKNMINLKKIIANPLNQIILKSKPSCSISRRKPSKLSSISRLTTHHSRTSKRRSEKPSSSVSSLLSGKESDDNCSLESSAHPPLLNTVGIPACAYKTKNGRVCILKDGQVELEFLRKARLIRISGDGALVTVESLRDSTFSDVFKTELLPPKYYSVYKYAYDVINLIKSKIPRGRYENNIGRFILMRNQPFPNYEAYFNSGRVLTHQVSSDKVLIKDGVKNFEIGLFNKDLESLDPVLKEEVEAAMKFLNVCLEQE